MLRGSSIIKLVLIFSLVLFGMLLVFSEGILFRFLDIFDKFHRSEQKATKVPSYKCNLSKQCPEGHFAFKMISGAASVVGPKICLEDNILMSSVKNNVGRGLNIALVNGMTGELIQTQFFDTWAGDVKNLIQFLNNIEVGTLVMMATFDDAARKLNQEVRQLISSFGSSSIHSLSFRDNWIFVGGKGLKSKSPFEQHLKNKVDSNKYEGWPEVLEMEGCIPQKQP